MIIFICLDAYAMHIKELETEISLMSATSCVFHGYPHDNKGWKFYDLDEAEYFLSLSAVFNEVFFSFCLYDQVSYLCTKCSLSSYTH